MAHRGMSLGEVRSLWGFLDGMRGSFVLAVLIHVAFKAAPLLTSFLGSYVVSVAVLRGPADILPLVAALVCLAALCGLLSYADVLVSHDVAYHVLARMRDAVYDKVDELAPAVMEDARSGEIVSVALEDVEILEQLFAHMVPQLLTGILLPLASIAALVFVHPAVALSVLPFALALAAVPLRTLGLAEEQGVRNRRLFGVLNAHVVDGVQGIKDVVSYQWERGFMTRFRAAESDYHAAQRAYALRNAGEQRLVSLIVGMGSLCTEGLAALLCARGAVDSVWLIPVFVLSTAVYAPLQDALVLSSSWGLITGAARRVLDLFAREPAVRDEGVLGAGEVRARGRASGVEVAFEDVRFAYPGSDVRPVLNGFDLRVEPGETVALVGASGCGKTTVSRLLQRIWDADGGVVTLNGVDVREMSLSALRDLVTVVTQDTYLFYASVADNLRLARPDATDEQILRALADAEALGFVSRLPQGVRTIVGERAQRLSGGERQRLSIARAFLRDTPVLVLDESSANLDSRTERLVSAAVDRLRAGRATLVIAHRTSTIRAADRIVMIRGGRAEATGTFDELVSACPHFAQLVGKEHEDGR